ncbi:hypothetical protein [Rhodococcus sp. 14-1411-2a]|uniref:hypothetical protein n=1 Tax=Rhodococcus sp. 14-1411-2a TaxID=2023151 RepID=UPI000B9A75DB|nr:hypothetical protein [Rhodococcus sp. 14-1411-2a]OZF42515.1 hypothetical protein CH291_26375 [Rhodococcus sp. 14-1411-2a]
MTTDNEAGIFDAWPTTFEPPTRRIVEPPKSVNVNIALAIGRSGGGGFRDTTPLKVRAEGLAMDSIVEGTLYAWARTGTGDWLARVSFSIPTGNKKGRLDLDRQWCPAAAITPIT